MTTACVRAWLILLLAAVSGVSASAQNSFNIPYSQFGLGLSEQPFNLPLATRMGGVVYTRSGNNFVNPFNPASYGTIESESFVFDMGVSLQTSTLRDRTEHMRDADGNLGYLLAAMPLTRWWKMAVGLMPYTSVNYESVYYGIDPTYPDTVKTIYDGSGGVNQVLLGTAFNVLKANGYRPSVQVGVSANWLVGGINRAISYAFAHNDSLYYLGKRRYKRTTMGNITLDFGLQARQALGERFTLGLGVVYKPYMDLKVKDLALIYSYQASDESLVDTIFPQRGEDPEFESRAERAQTVGIGLSFERNRQWQVAADVTWAAWQGMRYTEGQSPSIFGTSELQYGTYNRYALGFERMGNMDAASYWGRISWSVGVHRSTGCLYLMIDGQQQRVDEWGLGGGLTLPMRKGRSLLTLSAGWNTIGNRDILQRNTFTLGISVSSCEHWFFKRRYE